ncbi:MAG: dTDP-glucose 4,6-dehydratase [Lancefieldella parvula]|uniref:dTDP-glucose 4,6-dehydratase n=1 Tax=Lancefieldella parvula TaxID=1382 RepID=UPI00288079E7|nr:dTDP-glucose 4,6-dehydratase [Lancefieldella parvula]
MKTYLVTGGAGFIGSNFIHYMLKRNQDIHILNVDALTYAGNLENLSEYDQDPRYTFAHVDIRDKEVLTQLFKTHHPNYVVNFAAESHVDRSIEDPGAFADTNVMGTVALLSVAESFWNDGQGSYGNHRYLQVSTDEVYGSLPLDDPEAFFRETTPLSPHSPYSASKASADMFVKAWHDTYGFPAVITRCSNNYGPYQFPEKLIPLMIENCLEHKALPVYGDGLNVRDWLYVDDHCKAIAMVLEGGRLGEVYNIGGHNERNNLYIVKRIISEVARITGDTQITEDLISYVTDRKGHDRRYGIAPDKIKEELGWYPETPFEEGIVTTINWYLENRKWVKNVVSGDYQDYYKKMYEGR